jgi:hypothetical protein
MYLPKILVAVIAVVFVFMATEALADDEIYRWVDESGVVHFGDQPPAQTGAEQIVIEQPEATNSPASSGSEPTGQGDSEEPKPSYAQQLRDERAVNRKEAEEKAQIIAEACAQRRQLVSQLEPSTRVMVRMEDGTVTRMDDNIRLETLGEAKSYIAENCNK